MFEVFVAYILGKIVGQHSDQKFDKFISKNLLVLCDFIMIQRDGKSPKYLFFEKSLKILGGQNFTDFIKVEDSLLL